MKLLAVIVLSLRKANAKELDFRNPYLSFRKSRFMFVSIIFYILEENNYAFWKFLNHLVVLSMPLYIFRNKAN